MSGAEWGPWRRHDGGGVPAGVEGRWIEVASRLVDGRVEISGGFCHPELCPEVVACWSGGGFMAGFWCCPVLRYRVWRPAALARLMRLAEGVGECVG